MYLKSRGRNIIIREGKRQAMGWVPVAPPSTSPNPLSVLMPPSTPASSWQQLAAQAGGQLSSSSFASTPGANALAQMANLPRPPMAPPPPPSGGFFGNLLHGIQGAATNIFQTGKDLIGGIASGGGAAAQQQAQVPQYAPAESGMGTTPLLMLGGLGIAAYVLLKKKRA